MAPPARPMNGRESENLGSLASGRPQPRSEDCRRNSRALVRQRSRGTSRAKAINTSGPNTVPRSEPELPDTVAVESALSVEGPQRTRLPAYGGARRCTADRRERADQKSAETERVFPALRYVPWEIDSERRGDRSSHRPDDREDALGILPSRDRCVGPRNREPRSDPGRPRASNSASR